jgi:2-phospho-L-lactate guanylyltransferase
MQGTVSRFDESTRAGTVLLDDGVELPFPGTALDGSGLRHLRLGQRVRIEVVGDGADAEILKLQILTLH